MAKLDPVTDVILEVWGSVVRSVIGLNPDQKIRLADQLVEFARVTAIDLKGNGDGFAYALLSSHRTPRPTQQADNVKEQL